MPKIKKFEIPFENTKLIGDIIGIDSPQVIFLHGAGSADRTRFDLFRKLLNERGITSCAIDFIGHGETAGDLKTSSLEQRTNQVLATIEHLKVKEPFTIIASSMSGYTAIKVLEHMSVKNLIFFAPALYNPEAYRIPFGSGFSEVIRKSHSWENTDAWGVLREFKGQLMIFSAENDQVVPDELIEKLYASAIRSKQREIHIIKKANHPLVKYLNEHPENLDIVADKVAKAIL